MYSLEAGGFARIQVPQQLSEPYSNFYPIWITYVEQNHGRAVRLAKAAPMAHSLDSSLNEEWLDGWDVEDPGYPQENPYTPDEDCANWFPADWLIPIQDFPCNCSTRQILIKGCQISWHK